MKEKKKGPVAGKPIGPKRKAKAKRFLKSKQEELNSQEARLFLKFAETHPQAELPLLIRRRIKKTMSYPTHLGPYVAEVWHRSSAVA